MINLGLEPVYVSPSYNSRWLDRITDSFRLILTFIEQMLGNISLHRKQFGNADWYGIENWSTALFSLPFSHGPIRKQSWSAPIKRPWCLFLQSCRSYRPFSQSVSSDFLTFSECLCKNSTSRNQNKNFLDLYRPAVFGLQVLNLFEARQSSSLLKSTSR